jgi:ATP-dependent DNA helicase RecQ
LELSLENILSKYWGHAQFRPMQKDIIEAVLAKRDVLALLPTGGGKSVCFQVPTMAQDGLTIVISPLIALIKDQVEGLRSKGIKAISVVSGMTHREIDIALDNCIYDQTKFLFISPERITSTLFQERLKKMNVSLIAIDEAHCISQWGYDFRPAYLNIIQLREMLPGIPVIALTASATADVQQDIMNQLGFTNPIMFKQSFERKNLNYLVLQEADKFNRALRILNKTKGTAVIYVRNRKGCKDLSDWLCANQIVADYYHAGLDSKIRSTKQDDWMSGKTRVIVATNAFGMGIDKANVRLVIHMDLPDSLEAYYQEAGRAGRDEKNAYAILLYSDNDIKELNRKYLGEYPSIEDIKTTYEFVMNMLQIPIGDGLNQQIPFDLTLLMERSGFGAIKLINALKYLEKEGYFMLSDEVFNPFQNTNPKFQNLLQVILRSYTGLFDQLTSINENDLAARTQLSMTDIKSQLNSLQTYQVITYAPVTTSPLLLMTMDRLPATHVQIDGAYYRNRLAIITAKINAMVNYVKEPICRSIQLRSYFDEKQAKPCGQCDVCLLNQPENTSFTFQRLAKMIENEPFFLPKLLEQINDISENVLLAKLQSFAEDGLIQYNNKNEVYITPKGIIEKDHINRN